MRPATKLRLQCCEDRSYASTIFRASIKLACKMKSQRSADLLNGTHLNQCSYNSPLSTKQPIAEKKHDSDGIQDHSTAGVITMKHQLQHSRSEGLFSKPMQPSVLPIISTSYSRDVTEVSPKKSQEYLIADSAHMHTSLAASLQTATKDPSAS